VGVAAMAFIGLVSSGPSKLCTMAHCAELFEPGGWAISPVPRDQTPGAYIPTNNLIADNLDGGALGAPAMLKPGEVVPTWDLVGCEPPCMTNVIVQRSDWSFGFVDNVAFPTIASNTADLTTEQTYKALLRASAAGIKNVDFHNNAEIYGVAKAVKALGRDAFFLTTKINKPPEDMLSPLAAAGYARAQFESDMAILGVDTLDTLMMTDSPYCPVMQAQWAVMEDLYTSGRAKSIGVYNLCEAALRCVFDKAKFKPMIHYIMRHVGMGPDMDGLVAFGKAHGMKHAVYGSLGEPVALPELLSNPTLKAIASLRSRTVEEVAVKWNLQSGFAVDLRLNSNYGASNKLTMPDVAPYGSYCTDDCAVTIHAMASMFKWELTAAEMAQIDALRFDTVPQSPTYYSSGGCPNSFGAAIALAPKESSCPSSGSTWC